MTCKHERFHVFEWSEGDREEDAIHCEQHRCLDCGHWLSLGPSNDAPPEVAIEIRAAQIATEMEHDGRSMTSTMERYGFGATSLHLRNGAPIQIDTDPIRAGFLARAIVTHDTETP